MAGSRERAVSCGRALYASLVSRTRHRGLLLAVLVFMVAAGIADGARGDWVSVAVAAVIAVFCAVRWWFLGHGRPAPGRTAG